MTIEGKPGPVLYGTRVFRPGPFPEIFSPVLTDELKSLGLAGRPLRFAAGQTFSIVLSNPTGSCGVWPPAGDYAGGMLWYQGTGNPDWTPFQIPPDSAFQTVVWPRPGRR